MEGRDEGGGLVLVNEPERRLEITIAALRP